MNCSARKQEIVDRLEATLVRELGPIVGGKDLERCLGYATNLAFRVARSRGQVSLPLFRIPNRRGVFCTARDIAEWVVAHRETAVNQVVSAASATPGERKS